MTLRTHKPSRTRSPRSGTAGAVGGNWHTAMRSRQAVRRVLRSPRNDAAEPRPVPPLVHDVLRAPGAPLDASTRAFFEPRFGRDLSDVRLHSDARAAASARAIDARAYTVGTHIVLGAGAGAPGGEQTKRVMAHELTHVVQQSGQAANAIQRLADPDCGTTTALPMTGSCRSGFVHTCYSETFIPSSGAALNVEVTVGYSGTPPPGVEGAEDFSVQVRKCGLLDDTDIGSKRVSNTLPDTLRFQIASVTPGDKYYIKIYSRSHQNLDGSYRIWQ